MRIVAGSGDPDDRFRLRCGCGFEERFAEGLTLRQATTIEADHEQFCVDQLARRPRLEGEVPRRRLFGTPCSHGSTVEQCVTCHQLAWALGLCGCTVKPVCPLNAGHT